MPIPILGLLPDELCAQFSLQKAFQGKQIFQWIGQGAKTFDEMTNLPADLRARLSDEAVIFSGNVKKTLRDDDGTVKLQIAFPNENAGDEILVESVLLIDHAERKTACVSSQAGCAMGCAFCQTGQLGLKRNLSAAEIVEQFLLLEQAAGTIGNIVFMGMGEPTQNLAAVRKAIAVLTNSTGRNLSSRRITISTAGNIAGIYEMADTCPQIRLAVSLVTANPELRANLMPITRNNSLPDLEKAIAYHTQRSGKRCTLEVALLGGVNTGNAEIALIAEFARSSGAHVNLIPWNPVQSLPFKTPSAAESKNAALQLKKMGINATLRTKRGVKIGGACGQLGKT